MMPALASINERTPIAAAISCQVFDSVNDPALQALWRSEDARLSVSGFASYAYIKACYDAFIPGSWATPLIVAVADTQSNGLIAVVPLISYRRLGVQIIELLDYYVVDYATLPHDPVLLSDEAILKSAAEAFRSCLPSFDVFRSSNFVEHSTSLRFFCEAFGARNYDYRDLSFHVPLADGAYADFKASNRLYKKLKHKIRRLKREFDLEFKPARDPLEIDQVLAAMFEQRRSRFQQLGLVDGAADPRRTTVFRSVAHKLCSSNQALLLGAWIDGRCVATSFGACGAGGEFTSQLSSYLDGPWAKHSLGKVTMVAELDWAFEQGCPAYNCGAGESEYKQRFSTQQNHRVSLKVPLTPSGQLYLAMHKLKRSAISNAKYILRNTLLGS